jgi:hypothetical protein
MLRWLLSLLRPLIAGVSAGFPIQIEQVVPEHYEACPGMRESGFCPALYMPREHRIDEAGLYSHPIRETTQT